MGYPPDGNEGNSPLHLLQCRICFGVGVPEAVVRQIDKLVTWLHGSSDTSIHRTMKRGCICSQGSTEFLEGSCLGFRVINNIVIKIFIYKYDYKQTLNPKIVTFHAGSDLLCMDQTSMQVCDACCLSTICCIHLESTAYTLRIQCC